MTLWLSGKASVCKTDMREFDSHQGLQMEGSAQRRATGFEHRRGLTGLGFDSSPFRHRDVAQLGRARALGARCRRFKSCRPGQMGSAAQWCASGFEHRRGPSGSGFDSSALRQLGTTTGAVALVTTTVVVSVARWSSDYDAGPSHRRGGFDSRAGYHFPQRKEARLWGGLLRLSLR